MTGRSDSSHGIDGLCPSRRHVVEPTPRTSSGSYSTTRSTPAHPAPTPSGIGSSHVAPGTADGGGHLVLRTVGSPLPSDPSARLDEPDPARRHRHRRQQTHELECRQDGLPVELVVETPRDGARPGARQQREVLTSEVAGSTTSVFSITRCGAERDRPSSKRSTGRSARATSALTTRPARAPIRSASLRCEAVGQTRSPRRAPEPDDRRRCQGCGSPPLRPAAQGDDR